jgi:Uma2 family endonuclease
MNPRPPAILCNFKKNWYEIKSKGGASLFQ